MVVFKPRLHQDDDVANLILHDSRDPKLDSLANCEAAALLTRASHADIDVEYAPNDRLFSGELEKRVLSHHGCTPTHFPTPFHFGPAHTLSGGKGVAILRCLKILDR